MRLQRLALLNFRQHQRTEVRFADGLTGIIGPNGAGKTTLLEAIAFAIYGLRAARGGRDSIRWRRAAPRAEVRVELEFALGGHQYRVVRSLFNAELFLDGNPQPIVTGTTDVSDRLCKLLRMTHDEFFKTYFTGQKELAMMAELGPADRRRFLNKLLDYDRLLAAQKKVRERRAMMNAELQAIEAMTPDPLALAADRAGRTGEDAGARQRLAEAEEAFQKTKAASDQYLPVFTGLKEFQERYRTLKQAQALATERVAHAVENVRALTRERDEAKKLGAKREQRLAELDQRLEQARSSAKRVKALLESLEAARTKLEEENARYEEVRGAWDRDRADASATQRNLRDQFRDINAQKKRIAELGIDGTCPTCGRRLGDEYDAVMELIDGQLVEVTDRGKYYGKRVEQLQRQPRDLVAIDKRRHEATHVVEKLVQDVAVAKRAADDAVAMERERKRIVAEGERVPRLNAQVEEAGKKRAQLVDALAKIERELKGLEFDERKFLTAEKQMARLEQAWREAERAVSKASAEATVAAERLREAIRREEEAVQQLARGAELRGELRLHNELDRAFDDLSADLNAEIGPELSALASGFLAELTDGQYHEVQLDDAFNALVYEDGEPRPVISGGEEDLVNLVLRLGVSQMIADRSGQPLSLLVLDEIFGSLDEVRRESVMHLLRGLEARFPQVVLISHVEGVRESLDRVLRVRYDEATGAAVVTEEGPAGVPGGADDAHVAA